MIHDKSELSSAQNQSEAETLRDECRKIKKQIELIKMKKRISIQSLNIKSTSHVKQSKIDKVNVVLAKKQLKEVELKLIESKCKSDMLAPLSRKYSRASSRNRMPSDQRPPKGSYTNLGSLATTPLQKKETSPPHISNTASKVQSRHSLLNVPSAK